MELLHDLMSDELANLFLKSSYSMVNAIKLLEVIIIEKFQNESDASDSTKKVGAILLNFKNR